MGVRIIIDVAALLDAGCIVSQRIERLEADEQYPAVENKILDVIFPIKDQINRVMGFDFNVSDKLTVEADYNEWGTLKGRLAPILHDLNIPHIVV